MKLGQIRTPDIFDLDLQSYGFETSLSSALDP